MIFLLCLKFQNHLFIMITSIFLNILGGKMAQYNQFAGQSQLGTQLWKHCLQWCSSTLGMFQCSSEQDSLLFRKLSMDPQGLLIKDKCLGRVLPALRNMPPFYYSSELIRHFGLFSSVHQNALLKQKCKPYPWPIHHLIIHSINKAFIGFPSAELGSKVTRLKRTAEKVLSLRNCTFPM